MQEMFYLAMTMQSLSLLRADDFTSLLVSILSVTEHKKSTDRGVWVGTDPRSIIN